ncbi:hypothetical protein TVAG_113880 [Trichomonas vaginalis G3]|uniref:Uncharacterized protein n=1 Tax=Trichomonas vaginalis (strain ATCC PRA-98 / G3) TaxID=412133 RepID=A2DNP1_TRIV3|nr:regulation of tocopherol cyclase protein [Trichomonas vaginalis G3]EAY18044.1 hypothetical protein TVAG_113880 [Trichomonas vaginalis G3]KAI5524390.1 regulation of tocopherol cyclase protein [Trichomonas vaginalis G3]|eukprot:XP_001579030.1 hypothetical protein [Trichomonas vaginalis G3]
MSVSHSNTFTDLLKYIGIDYILHHEESRKILDDTTSDAFWAIGSNNTMLWLIQNQNSRWFVRQFASSIYHFGRLAINFGYSSTDMVISKIMHPILPKVPEFSSLASKQRFYKRMMLTLRLNGGVYAEFGQIIRNCVNALPETPYTSPYYKINQCYPVIKGKNTIQVFDEFIDNKPTSGYSLEELRNIFTRQTGYNLNEIVLKVEPEYKTCGPLIYHNAVLRTGQKVTITVLPPHIDRMRFLDLLPFKILRGFMMIVPFISREKSIYDTIMRRLDFNLIKEVNSRNLILNKLGIDTKSSDPAFIFPRARRAPISISVPAPLTNYCGRNVMITDRMPPPLESSIPSYVAVNIADFWANLLTKYNLSLPDISSRNVLAGYNGIALARYSSVTPVSKEDIHYLIKLHHSIVYQNRDAALKLAPKLGLSPNAVERSIQLNTIDPLVLKQLMKNHSQTLLSVGESFVNILNLKNETGRKSIMMPVIAGYAAKMASPNYSTSNFPYNIISWARYFRV